MTKRIMEFIENSKVVEIRDEFPIFESPLGKFKLLLSNVDERDLQFFEEYYKYLEDVINGGWRISKFEPSYGSDFNFKVRNIDITFLNIIVNFGITFYKDGGTVCLFREKVFDSQIFSMKSSGISVQLGSVQFNNWEDLRDFMIEVKQ